VGTHHLLRVLADFLPGRSPCVQASTVPSAPPTRREPQSPTQPREVGRGESNETFVTISGVPHLFVDEGDCIVQFRPAFDESPRDTRFGTKILPELVPHWSLQREDRISLKEAISMAIRANGVPTATLPDPHHAGHTVTQDAAGEGEAPARRRVSREHVQSRDDNRAATTGKVLGWGEEKFPNRKPAGKPFYTSFAMHIETAMGEHTLQGEGLKDAIAQSGCRVGDSVSVRRLDKIKVPAFTDGGRPIMKNGQQVLWDKWLWSITRN
jgi:hypothetical protein